MQKVISILNDPVETATSLVRENGLKRALEIAVQGTATATSEGNFYDLSVWREVKSILRKGSYHGA